MAFDSYWVEDIGSLLSILRDPPSIAVTTLTIVVTYESLFRDLALAVVLGADRVVFPCRRVGSPGPRDVSSLLMRDGLASFGLVSRQMSPGCLWQVADPRRLVLSQHTEAACQLAYFATVFLRSLQTSDLQGAKRSTLAVGPLR